MGGKSSKGRTPKPVPVAQPTGGGASGGTVKAYREPGVSRHVPRPSPAPVKPEPLKAWMGPNGVYPGACNFSTVAIRCHISSGNMAPRWPPVDEDNVPEGVETHECPVCFNAFAGHLNDTVCCTQQLCTECYLYVQTPAHDKACPYCQRDAFHITFPHTAVTSIASVTAAASAKAAATPPKAAASAGGGSVPIPSPVLTASVAHRRQLEEAVAAQSADRLAADLTSAERDRGGSLSLSEPPPRRRGEGRRPSSGRRGRAQRRLQYGEASEQRGMSLPVSPRGSILAHMAQAGLGEGGGEMDMALMEKLMLLHAMRASLADAPPGAGEGGDGAPSPVRAVSPTGPSEAAPGGAWPPGMGGGVSLGASVAAMPPSVSPLLRPAGSSMTAAEAVDAILGGSDSDDW